MVRGRPQGDAPTCVLAVRGSMARREPRDRSRAARETRSGLTASRHASIRQAWRRCLAAPPDAAWPAPPPGCRAPCGRRGASPYRQTPRHTRRAWRGLPGWGAGAVALRPGGDGRPGLRTAARLSGGSCPHQGPRGATGPPARVPAVPHAARASTVTWSRAAAARARERPAPRGPRGQAAGPNGPPRGRLAASRRHAL